MFSRISALILCLGLLVPTCRPEDKTSSSAATSEPREKQAVTESVAVEATPSPATLSQEEESSLTARSEEPGPEVSGGALSNLHLTYAVIALAAIVLVLLIK